ncbi:MAG: VWA domain-containing protein [Candidatus Ozemobacteraceae bacterium]
MKRITLLALGFLMIAPCIFGEGFSSAIEGVSALDFPHISLRSRVFSPEPILPTSDSFELFEMETRIATFQVEMLKPKQYVVLILDRSSSMEPVMGLVKNSANAFVETMTPKIQTSLLSFASDIDLGTDFTNDVRMLQSEIGKIRPYGGTALFDALYKTCELLISKAGPQDVKTIVCLTDGKDESPRGQANFSIKKPAEVAKIATRNGIRIITVGLGNNLDENFLKKIAQFTGGWYLHSPTIKELSEVFRDITKKILMEQRYKFVYQTPNPKFDGTKRDLTVVSLFKGQKDQGKGSYVAPTTPPKPETISVRSSEKGTGKKVTIESHDWELTGPDSTYLTGPILPGPPGPVFGPSGVDFVRLSPAEVDALLRSSEIQIRNDHANNLKRQAAYLDDFITHLDSMLKTSESEFAQSSQADYEQQRLEYRKGLLARRKNEVELIRQECQEEHDAALEGNLRHLELQRQQYVRKEPVPGNAKDEVSVWKKKKDEEIDKKFKKLRADQDKEEEEFKNSFNNARGSHVINEKSVQTSFTVGNSTEDQKENTESSEKGLTAEGVAGPESIPTIDVEKFKFRKPVIDFPKLNENKGNNE